MHCRSQPCELFIVTWQIIVETFLYLHFQSLLEDFGCIFTSGKIQKDFYLLITWKFGVQCRGKDQETSSYSHWSTYKYRVFLLPILFFFFSCSGLVLFCTNVAPHYCSLYLVCEQKPIRVNRLCNIHCKMNYTGHGKSH